MTTFTLSLLFLVLTNLAVPASSKHHHHGHSAPDSHVTRTGVTSRKGKGEDMYLLLSQFWVAEECQIPGYAGSEACETTTLPTTIHGLWVDYVGGGYPDGNKGDCPDGQAELHESDIAPIEEALNVNWPTMKKGDTSSFSFWSHEWSKHGRCWQGTPLPYFEQGLKLHDRFDVKSGLIAEGVVPGEPMATEEALRAWGAVVGDHDVVLTCEHGKYVLELRFCLAWDGEEVIDCPNPGATNCGDTVIFA